MRLIKLLPLLLLATSFSFVSAQSTNCTISNGVMICASVGGFNQQDTTAQTPTSPKYNAMNCSSPSFLGKQAGEVACYGVWDYGNEFGDDKDMCQESIYGKAKTGCIVKTTACVSGSAVATRVLFPTSSSQDISVMASNFKTSTGAVSSSNLLNVWEYTCQGTTTQTAPNDTSPVLVTVGGGTFYYANPVISGYASGINSLGLVISNGDKVYGSGHTIKVDSNGKWSHTVSSPLNTGDYQVIVYDTNNMTVASGTITILLDVLVSKATYKGYLGGSETPFIITENISKTEALENCKINSSNNPTKSIRCTWNGVEMYSYPATVTISTSTTNCIVQNGVNICAFTPTNTIIGCINQNGAIICPSASSTTVVPVEKGINLVASADSVMYGDIVDINWTTNGFKYCSSNWNSRLPISGNYKVKIYGDRTFTVNCYDAKAKKTSKSLRVILKTPTVEISATPTSLEYGKQAQVTWSSTGAASCNFTRGDTQFIKNENTTSGTNRYTQSLYKTQTYTVRCKNGSKVATKSVTVDVACKVLNVYKQKTLGTTTYDIYIRASGLSSGVTLPVSVGGVEKFDGLKFGKGSNVNTLKANQTFNFRETEAILSQKGSISLVQDGATVCQSISGVDVTPTPTIVATGTLMVYFNGQDQAQIVTGDLTKVDALASCKKSIGYNQSATSARCTWNGEQIYSVPVSTLKLRRIQVSSKNNTAYVSYTKGYPTDTCAKVVNENFSITGKANLCFSGTQDNFNDTQLVNLFHVGDRVKVCLDKDHSVCSPTVVVTDFDSDGAFSVPSSWKSCAKQDQVCSFLGTKKVYYGSSGVYTNGTFTDSVTCSNAFFGDPWLEVDKQCFYEDKITQSVTFSDPVHVASSPLSQFMIGGTANDIAKFKLKTQTGDVVVKKLHFKVLGADSVMSVSVNGVTSVPVVLDEAVVADLSIPVSTNGTDVSVAVKFNGFRNSTIGGSLTQGVSPVSITLASIEAVSGSGYVITKQTSVSSNSMTLVASKPTVIGMSGVGTLSTGMQKLGEFTVIADANGKIAVSKVSLTLSKLTSGGFDVTGVKISEDNGSTAISNVVSNPTSGQAFDLSFTNNYEIGAGQSKIFQVWGIVAGSFDLVNVSKTSLTLNQDGFRWVDVVGGNKEYTGKGIYNFPTTSYTLTNGGFGDQPVNPPTDGQGIQPSMGGASLNIKSNLSSTGSNGQVLGISTSNLTCANITYNLHRGAESKNVTKLQNFLKEKGFLNEVTGFYGDKTIAAVKDYQGSLGLPVTGMVYSATREAIRSESCN